MARLDYGNINLVYEGDLHSNAEHAKLLQISYWFSDEIPAGTRHWTNAGLILNQVIWVESGLILISQKIKSIKNRAYTYLFAG